MKQSAVHRLGVEADRPLKALCGSDPLAVVRAVNVIATMLDRQEGVEANLVKEGSLDFCLQNRGRHPFVLSPKAQ